MNRTNTSDVVKKQLEELLDKGLTNKRDIYQTVSDNLGLHRVVIRRIARELRQDYQKRIKILQDGI